jgi:hypothetical protein
LTHGYRARQLECIVRPQWMMSEQPTRVCHDLRRDRNQGIAVGEVGAYTSGKHEGTIVIEVVFAYLSL